MTAAGWVAPLPAVAQGTVIVSTSKSCRTCRILVDTVVHLGSVEGPGAVSQQANVKLGRNGRYYVVSNVDPGVIKVFNSDGSYLRQFGRRGRGPGEFQNPWHIIASSTAVHVFDIAEFRVTALSNAFALIDTKQLPLAPMSVAQLSASRFVMAGDAMTPDRIGMPLHIYDYARGAVVRSFGATSQRVIARGDPNQKRHVAAGKAGTFWAAHVNRLRVERWDTGGRMLAAYERDADWFVPWQRYVGTARTHRPQPSVRDIMEDSQGRLWVMILTAAEDWKPLPPARVHNGMSYTSDAQRNLLYSTVIEVLEFEGDRAHVYTSYRWRGELLGFMDAGVVAAYAEDAEGNPRYDVLRMRIVQ